MTLVEKLQEKINELHDERSSVHPAVDAVHQNVENIIGDRFGKSVKVKNHILHDGSHGHLYTVQPPLGRPEKGDPAHIKDLKHGKHVMAGMLHAKDDGNIVVYTDNKHDGHPSTQPSRDAEAKSFEFDPKSKELHKDKSILAASHHLGDFIKKGMASTLNKPEPASKRGTSNNTGEMGDVEDKAFNRIPRGR